MYRGSFVHSLDDKFRLIIPLKFRSRLGETFVLTRGLEGCIFVLPEEQFGALVDVVQGNLPLLLPRHSAEPEPSPVLPDQRALLAELSIRPEHRQARRTFDPAARQLQRFFVADAVDVQADGQGRVALPQSLREHAGIDREAVVVGAGNRVEIWSRERWAALNAGLSDDTVMAAAAALGIL